MSAPSWDVCAVRPASMVWSAAGAMVTLSAPPPPAATPDLRRVTPPDTQGLLGQCEIGEERRTAAPFWGCPAAATQDFCMKGLKEGLSIFQGSFYTAKRAHHITKGHYHPTWGPFPPPKKPNYAIKHPLAPPNRPSRAFRSQLAIFRTLSPKGPKSYGEGTGPCAPPLVCALGRSASSQSNQRLCPLLRRDFQRWLHWRVTDAEIPGVLRSSSSRQPLTLVKRQRGAPRPPPRVGHQAAARWLWRTAARTVSRTPATVGRPACAMRACFGIEVGLASSDGPVRSAQLTVNFPMWDAGTTGSQVPAAYSHLRRTYPLATMRRGCSCSP